MTSPLLGQLAPLTLRRRGAMVYILRDEFTTTASAPLTSPRTCEPGPGTLTITDTGNRWSIASTRLTWSAITNAFNPVLISGTFARATGRALLGNLHSSGTGGEQIGFHNSSSPFATGNRLHGIYADTGVFSVLADGGQLAAVASGFSATTEYPTATIMRSTGYFDLVKVSGTWQLMWWDDLGTDATLRTFYAVLFANAGYLEYLRVRDVGGAFATDTGIATLSTTAVANSDYTGTADAIYDLTVTAPTVLAGEAGLRFRVLDASNYYYAYFNNLGQFRVDRVVAGMATNLALVNGVISGSAVRTIRIITNGTSLRFFTRSGTTYTARGTATDSTYTSNTTLRPVADVSWTGGGGSVGALSSYPRTSSNYAVLDVT